MWSGRAATLLSLGYGELAVADAHKGLLLCGASLRLMSEDLSATPASSSLTDRVRVTLALTLPKKNRTKAEWMHAISVQAKAAEEFLYSVMAQGLVSIRAFFDAVEVLKEAVMQYPTSPFFNTLPTKIRANLKTLEQDFGSHGYDKATVEWTKKRGRVDRVAYPWIIPSEFVRGVKAVKKVKARFEASSSNASIDHSLLGDTAEKVLECLPRTAYKQANASSWTSPSSRISTCPAVSFAQLAAKIFMEIACP